MAPDRSHGPPPRRRASGSLLLVAFAAVVASFVANTAYTEHLASSIDRAAVDIAFQAMPRIQHLAATAAELRRFNVLLRAYVSAAAKGRAANPGDVMRTRAAVDTEIRPYLARQYFPGEGTIRANVTRELAVLDDLVNRTIGEITAHDFEKAEATIERELEPQIERVVVAIRACHVFYAQQAARLALEIETARTRNRRIAIGLDMLSAVLAVAAALLAARSVRRYTGLIEEHNRVVELRARELELFASRVAHDVLSPLTSVEMSLAMAAKTCDEGADLIDRGRRGVQRVRRIVDDLLDFARAAARPKAGASADVREVLADIEAELRPDAAAANVDLVLEPFPRTTVACSAGVLTSLISNLLRNSLKYLGERPVRRIRVRVRDRGAAARVEVEDTGPGLPPGLEASVFEIYVRADGASVPGLGLGLATVKRLAEAHGGAVGVRSTPGVGSTFWFELPKGAASPRSEARVGSPPGSSRRDRPHDEDRLPGLREGAQGG